MKFRATILLAVLGFSNFVIASDLATVRGKTVMVVQARFFHGNDLARFSNCERAAAE